jgi:hypothetical protein
MRCDAMRCGISISLAFKLGQIRPSVSFPYPATTEGEGFERRWVGKGIEDHSLMAQGVPS